MRGHAHSGTRRIVKLNRPPCMCRDVRQRMEGSGGPPNTDTRMLSLRTPEPLRG